MSDACSMVGDGDLDASQHDLDAAVELFATTGHHRHPNATHAPAITTATATAIAYTATATVTAACCHLRHRSSPRQASAITITAATFAAAKPAATNPAAAPLPSSPLTLTLTLTLSLTMTGVCVFRDMLALDVVDRLHEAYARRAQEVDAG